MNQENDRVLTDATPQEWFEICQQMLASVQEMYAITQTQSQEIRNLIAELRTYKK